MKNPVLFYGAIVMAVGGRREMKDLLERYAAKSRTALTLGALVVMILAGLSACAQGSTATPTFSNRTPIQSGLRSLLRGTLHKMASRWSKATNSGSKPSTMLVGCLDARSSSSYFTTTAPLIRWQRTMTR